APARLPAVDAAGFQVTAHEVEVSVAARVARDAPLLAVFREMAVAEQNAVQAGVLIVEPGDRHDFLRDHLGHVVACAQLTGVHPLWRHLALLEPGAGSCIRLLHGYAAQRPARMPGGDP